MGSTFVDEKKSAIVVFDILSSELMKSTFSEDCEVIIISPWVKDYPIPSTWPNFSSNFYAIKDMQKISDILKKLRQNKVRVTLCTKSEKRLRDEKWGEWNIRAAVEFHERITEKDGATVCWENRDEQHAKYVVTSENVFITSANATPKGTAGVQGNAGSLNSKRDSKDFYDETRKWCFSWLKKTENPDDYFSK